MKISSKPPESLFVDVVESSDAISNVTDKLQNQSIDSMQKISTNAEIESASGIAKIVNDITVGKIDRQEAVNRIIADSLNSRLVDSIPPNIRANLEETLRGLIEEDPYLQSLCAAIGPTKTE